MCFDRCEEAKQDTRAKSKPSKEGGVETEPGHTSTTRPGVKSRAKRCATESEEVIDWGYVTGWMSKCWELLTAIGIDCFVRLHCQNYYNLRGSYTYSRT